MPQERRGQELGAHGGDREEGDMEDGQGMTFGIRKYWKNVQNPSIWVLLDVFGDIWICNNTLRKNLEKFDLY